jgi:alpha-glucosidase (family GH31 glycosyl hydrolase)
MSEFPDDENTFDIDESFMLGSSLLIQPVVEKDSATSKVYLPPSAV